MITLNKRKPGKDNTLSPGFFRHLAIIIYDALLLLALLFLATALVLPLNHGEAFSSSQFFFPIYILTVSFLYYGWFWTHGGQTLGMKTWKVKIRSQNYKAVTWPLAFKRFIIAIFSWACAGLGLLWKFVDKEQLTWHDKFSGTRLFFDRNND